ncbi:MAG: NADP-dependent 3-hydroxy acid dehydrogenase YdfG [Pseudomonas sp.]|nr:NADP-dependent 3-hydroxy acid dehydrogenase YdfG [Pseudomonas sp.]
MSKVWLITGSASGLGRNIAEAVLAAGDRLVATARNPQRLDDLVERYGDQIRAVELDVTDSLAAQKAVQVAVVAFGRLDVLVNNAGFGQLVPFEQTEEAAFREEFDTNFFGVVNVTRAVVPLMRKQGSGHIIQVSSVGGRTSTAGMSAYQSAKWAVGGFSDVLALELNPLGIHVTTLEPGGMRTNWVVRASNSTVPVMAEYQETVGKWQALLKQYAGNENSNPDKVAQVVLSVANHSEPPKRLLLGSDAVHYAGLSDADRAASDAQWKSVSVSTDFAAPVLPKG